MNKIETIKENWTEIIDRLRSDKQELAQFLRFSAGMYKQSFSDAALIYHQNPNTTKVATLETWNKLGRLVNKGEHSIAVFGEGSRAKHLFDISQTNGKRLPELWKLTEDLSAELIAVINKKYGRDCKNIQETIAAMSVDNIRPHLSEMMYATGQLKLTDNDSQDIIDHAAELEMTYVADRLCMLERDVRGDYGRDFFIPKEMVSGGFPERIERVKISMLDKKTLQKYIEGMTEFVDWFEKSGKKNRYRYTFKELLRQLKDLQISRKEFITNVDFTFEPKFFITEDEKDRLLTLGGNVEGGKFRIEKFFKEEHTAKEKADFLKREYGIGGSGRSGYNTWHDSKGLRYKKDALTSNDCEVTMKWNEAAKRVDILIAEDKYITQSDIDKLIRSAKYTVKNHKITSEYDKAVVDNAKKILAEYGVEIDNKSPLENIIEKAEAAGVPVETIAEPAEEKAVFMDVRDETFIAVEQIDEGISYSVYASDLTLVDGGVWEMDYGMDLKSAAADLLATTETVLADYPDYDSFLELVDTFPIDFGEKLAKIKSDIFAKINPPQKNISENPAVNAPEKISVPDIKQPKSGVPVTYHFSPENVAAGGAKSKFNSNVEAIKTLQKVEAENRFAAPEEQAVMAKYVGWGGIPQAFVSDKIAENISGNLGEAAPSGWENEQKELLELLSPEEYKAARASTLTSFYTPPDVTDGIYQALTQFGFEGGNVLEPSMGVGNFFAKMPEDMRDNSKLYGVELDSMTNSFLI